MKIVKISSLGCTSCIIMNNIFNELTKELNLNVVDLDYDFDDIEKYSIGNILPEIIVFDDNDNEQMRIVGEKTKNEVKNIILKYKGQ